MFHLVVVQMTMFIFLLHSCDAEAAVDKKCSQKGYQYNNVILLQLNNCEPTTMELNKLLLRECGHIYDFVEDTAMYKSAVGGMINAKEIYRYVVNLNVNDYYNTAVSYIINKGLAYAGDLNITGPIHRYAWHNTSEGTIRYNNVKMVSENVTDIDGGLLYHFISRMDYLPEYGPIARMNCSDRVANSDLDIVLVCLDKQNDQFDMEKMDRQFCPLKFRFVPNCRDEVHKYRNKLLAVLAPEPFDIKCDPSTTVPTMFYETSFMYQDNLEMFPNLIVSDRKMLKYPILSFLNNMQWRRVAIITDDSPDSVAFEENLTALFREHDIMYDVKRCENRTDCNRFFENVWATLQNEGARIIVANFHERYISHIDLQSFMWILREWSPKWTHYISHGFSVTLAPAGRGREKYAQLGLNPTNDSHTRIVEYIKHIYNASRQMAIQSNVNDVNRNKFYRELASRIKMSMKSMDYVSRVIDKYSTQIAYMEVTGNKPINAMFTRPNVKISDVPNCIFKSNDYFNPCNDNELILIMCVVIVFAVSLLIVILYFHNSPPMQGPHYISF